MMHRLHILKAVQNDLVLANSFNTSFLLPFKLSLYVLIRDLLSVLPMALIVLIYKVDLPWLCSFLEVVWDLIAPHIKVFATWLPGEELQAFYILQPKHLS